MVAGPARGKFVSVGAGRGGGWAVVVKGGGEGGRALLVCVCVLGKCFEGGGAGQRPGLGWERGLP